MGIFLFCSQCFVCVDSFLWQSHKKIDVGLVPDQDSETLDKKIPEMWGQTMTCTSVHGKFHLVYFWNVERFFPHQCLQPSIFISKRLQHFRMWAWLGRMVAYMQFVSSINHTYYLQEQILLLESGIAGYATAITCKWNLLQKCWLDCQSLTWHLNCAIGRCCLSSGDFIGRRQAYFMFMWHFINS